MSWVLTDWPIPYRLLYKTEFSIHKITLKEYPVNISPSEAEEALATIQAMMQKTRRAISSSGAYLFLIVWGVVWLLGFLGSQFLPLTTAGYGWMVLDTLGESFPSCLGSA